MSVTDYAQALHQEIDQTPKEYLEALLNIVHTFRESVSLPLPVDSVEQALKETLSGETYDISTLWNDVDAN
ncbi:MAG: hypothetical protein COA79_19555 [Planctomycetota bacterium]|nr:MAG: hypothetical protein COA79_19555 [Planctomycetota bacterium]